MAIGNAAAATVAGLNVSLGDVAVSARNWAQQATALWSYVQSLGANEAAQVAALAAMTGWQNTSTDPQSFWTDANSAFAVAQFYYGQLATPPQFDYDNALAGARGGA